MISNACLGNQKALVTQNEEECVLFLHLHPPHLSFSFSFLMILPCLYLHLFTLVSAGNDGTIRSQGLQERIKEMVSENNGSLPITCRGTYGWNHHCSSKNLSQYFRLDSPKAQTIAKEIASVQNYKSRARVAKEEHENRYCTSWSYLAVYFARSASSHAVA